MYAGNEAREEVRAASKYLDIISTATVHNDVGRQGLEEDAKYRVENDITVNREVPTWSDEKVIAAKLDVVAEYANVDPKMYDPYFAATSSEGNLKMEEPMMTQDMYGELTKVLQEVITNENADIQALLDTANANFQKILDDNVNK